MTRSKVLLAWSALLLGLAACDKTTDSGDEKTKPANLTVALSSTELTAGGTAVDVSVAATSDTGIVSIAPTIKNASGALATGSFLPQFTTMPKVGDKTFASSGWKLSALSTATAGSYTMTLTLTEKSGAIATKEVAFTVKAKSGTIDPVDPVDPDPTIGEPLVRLGEVTVGAQNSVNPSFMQLTGAKAGSMWTSGAGIPYAHIDVIFGADGTTPTFFSPDYASSSGAFSLSSWTTRNTSAIVDMGTSKPAHTGVVYDALVASPRSSAAVVSGRYYGIGTESGDLVVLYVKSVNGTGRSADAVVDIFLEEGGTVVDPTPIDWPKIDLGAQNAIQPSALDVDGGVGYTSGAKTAEEIASIDLLLYFELGKLEFISPSYAGANGISLVNGWGTKNETHFYDNGTTPVTDVFEALSALEGNDSRNYVNVVAGHFYIVEHASGVISVIKVESITGSGASAVVKVSIVFSDDMMAG